MLEFEHFDHGLADTLMETNNIYACDEEDFVTASEGAIDAAPS